MALNIKSETADRLVEELANLTGESKTQAVIQSVRERLERETRLRAAESLSAEMMEIGRRCAAHSRDDIPPHGDLLYDERGLPG